jgi:hypothetical protein
MYQEVDHRGFFFQIWVNIIFFQYPLVLVIQFINIHYFWFVFHLIYHIRI